MNGYRCDEDIIQNLKDAGCDGTTIACFMDKLKSGKQKEGAQLLQKHRCCHDVILKNVSFANAAETLWHCDGVTMEQVIAKGDYFAMNSENMVIHDLTLYGNYSFDGVKNVEIHNSRLLSKDAFWNSENVLLLTMQ